MNPPEGATRRDDASVRKGGFVICTGPSSFPLNQQDWALAARLAGQGERVTLVLNSSAGLASHIEQGCSVVAWPSGNAATWRDAKFFWRLLGRERPRAVLATFFSTHMAMLLASVRRVPCRVAWYRALRDQDRLDTARGNLLQRAIEAGKSLSMRAATHVVAVSPAGRRDVCRHYSVPEPKCTVFHTCRQDPMELLAGERPARSAERLIVSVGRMVQSKGQDLLLQAFARLRVIEPEWNLQLELVGAGPLQERYETLARELGIDERVRFAGAIPHAEVYRRLARAHVVAFPFRSDPGPGVIVEALGLGVPIIASVATGAQELLGDSEAVVLVPSEDTMALADALLAAMRDPERMATIAGAGRQVFLSRFHLDHWLRDVAQWLEHIAPRRALDGAPAKFLLDQPDNS